MVYVIDESKTAVLAKHVKVTGISSKQIINKFLRVCAFRKTEIYKITQDFTMRQPGSVLDKKISV